MHTRMASWMICISVLMTGCATNSPHPLDKILTSEHRTPAYVARDQYRHPKKTLAFFDVKPDMTVAEIWPSGGWYAEILAPYLKDQGQYYAVDFSLSANRTPNWRKNMARKLRSRFKNNPEIYGAVTVTSLSIPEDPVIAPDNSLDRVLTFRNVHNWMKGDYAADVFTSMFKALKPGGILGVVEHRALPDTSLQDMKQSGYVSESHVIHLATQAGFALIDRSDINANPKDKKNHPKGVWTLPPSLRLGEEHKDKYLIIGESDRMTLKFKKPE